MFGIIAFHVSLAATTGYPRT